MAEPIKSRRGVYYDLNQSPYEYNSPYGDCFKFSSAKKLEIYTRDISKELKRIDNLLQRHNLQEHIPEEIRHLLYRKMHQSFYRKIEG
jgi:hypothetical protein